MPGKKDKGDETEHLIASIAKNVVLRDFVVQNPKFKKQNGQEKELTDLLVPFGESVISIQAKSKVVDTTKASAEVIDTRIQKIINNAIGQLTNTKRIVDEGEVYHYKNSLGIEVPLDSPRVKNIHGLVLVNVYDQNNAHIRIDGSFVRGKGMPIHVLDVADFYAVASEIDTIPDLIGYLSARAKLYEGNKIDDGVNELDLLVVYKTQPDVVEQVLSDDRAHLMVAPGLWGDYQSGSADAIKKRNELNRASYLVDMTIEEMAKSIDYTPLEKNPITGEPMLPGTIEHYWALICDLSKLKRMERRIFGNKMKEKMERANDPSYREGWFLYLTKPDEAILFYSTDTNSRQERVEKLAALAGTAYAAKDLNKIIAIGTEPIRGHGRSLDVILYKDVEITNKEQLKEQAKRMFDDGSHYEGYEYSG